MQSLINEADIPQTKINPSPLFCSRDIGNDLTFINCSQGYDGKPNMLFLENATDKAIANRKKGECEFGLFSETPQSYLLVKLSEKVETIKLTNQYMNFTHGIQIAADKYLFACGKSTFDENDDNYEAKNCLIFDGDGQLLNSFYISDGVTDIQTNEKNEIIIAFYDRAIYCGNGTKGLDIYDETGEKKPINLEYDVIDCNGINVISSGVIFAFVYRLGEKDEVSDLCSLLEIKDKKLSRTWNAMKYKSPYMAVSGDHVFLTDKKWDINNGILYEINDELNPLVRVEFFTHSNEPLYICAARKDMIYCWGEDSLFVATIDDLWACLKTHCVST
jgi:hypothetical protein